MKNWKQRLEAYGRVGFYVYLAIWLGTLAVFFTLLELGLQDELPWLAEHAGQGASLAGAWLLTKVVQVPRIAATLAVTPAVARWTKRGPPADVEPAR